MPAMASRRGSLRPAGPHGKIESRQEFGHHPRCLPTPGRHERSQAEVDTSQGHSQSNPDTRKDQPDKHLELDLTEDEQESRRI